MRRHILTFLACVTFGAIPLAAQDATITNARIIVGNGTVIEHGSIVIRGGKIVGVSAGAPSAPAGQVIDAKGMSAMPGFIDAHRHINTGPNEKAQMQAQLEAGYTTILSGGGPGPGNITLRDHIESGQINGPRIIPSGSLRITNTMTADAARAEIRNMAAQGIKFTGEILLTPIPGPTEHEIEVLKAVVDEGKKVGVMIQVHAVSSKAMVAAVDAGVPLLVHLPNKDWVSKEDAKKVAASGAKVLGTVGFAVPTFGVFGDDPNRPTFRDGKAWPEGIIDGVRLGEEAGYMPVNARTIWDAGAVLGYCTDTTYDPLAGLAQELKANSLVFTPKDLIRMMGPNTASYIQMADQLGTLEVGKLADVILLDGNPLEGYWNFLKTKVVLKGGKVVVDKR
ncbi:MAG TPA: amidohydrolase family protein [Terriglobia bacterium]|nr:amidohydrolase family protein [Terriglobia bacterium]